MRTICQNSTRAADGEVSVTSPDIRIYTSRNGSAKINTAVLRMNTETRGVCMFWTCSACGFACVIFMWIYAPKYRLVVFGLVVCQLTRPVKRICHTGGDWRFVDWYNKVNGWLFLCRRVNPLQVWLRWTNSESSGDSQALLLICTDECHPPSFSFLFPRR